MNSIICYIMFFAEAVLIIFMLAKIHGAYSRINILSSLTKELRDDYFRVLASWKKSIDNTNETIELAKKIVNTNEELCKRLEDKNED